MTALIYHLLSEACSVRLLGLDKLGHNKQRGEPTDENWPYYYDVEYALSTHGFSLSLLIVNFAHNL